MIVKTFDRGQNCARNRKRSKEIDSSTALHRDRSPASGTRGPCDAGTDGTRNAAPTSLATPTRTPMIDVYGGTVPTARRAGCHAVVEPGLSGTRDGSGWA